MRTYIKSKQLIVDPELLPIPHGIVVFENNKIVDVGTVQTIVIPLGSNVIDCTEDTVMPGLIDSHSHITMNGSYSIKYKMANIDQNTLDLPTAVLRGSMNLRSDLEAGVTTMRTLGDISDVELRFREAIDREDIPGPRLVISIRALRPSHGTAPTLSFPADGVVEIRKMIRQNFSMGARVVKLFLSDVSNGISDEDYRRGDLTKVPAYTRDEILAAIGEAHDLGMRVAGHTVGGQAMRWAIEAGIDSIEHANMLEDKDIDYFVKYGTRISDPNLQLFFDEETGFPSRNYYKKFEWYRQKVFNARKLTEKNLPKAIDAGVKVSLAVDIAHSFLWKEAKYLVAIGATNTEALKAVTKNSAELLGLQDSIGTLEKGKLADIISVKGNPLEDISVLKDVRLVIKDGKLFHINNVTNLLRLD